MEEINFTSKINIKTRKILNDICTLFNKDSANKRIVFVTELIRDISFNFNYVLDKNNIDVSLIQKYLYESTVRVVSRNIETKLIDENGSKYDANNKYIHYAIIDMIISYSGNYDTIYRFIYENNKLSYKDCEYCDLNFDAYFYYRVYKLMKKVLSELYIEVYNFTSHNTLYEHYNQIVKSDKKAISSILKMLIYSKNDSMQSLALFDMKTDTINFIINTNRNNQGGAINE